MFTTTTSTMPAKAAQWPATALTRVWVKFKDGTKKHFHSFDSSGRFQVSQPEVYGIKGLAKRVLKEFNGKIEAAVLYDNQTKKELEKWVIEGELTQHALKWF